MEDKDCYVGIKKCGCLVGIVVNDLNEEDLKNILNEFKEDGYTIESMKIKEALKKLKDCKCEE
jgi:hypothetical protein